MVTLTFHKTVVRVTNICKQWPCVTIIEMFHPLIGVDIVANGQFKQTANLTI